MVKYANSARKEFHHLFDGGDDGEHTGLGFVDISQIFVTQDTCFFESLPLCRIYHMMCVSVSGISFRDFSQCRSSQCMVIPIVLFHVE